jgi:hypothetical protein
MIIRLTGIVVLALTFSLRLRYSIIPLERPNDSEPCIGSLYDGDKSRLCTAIGVAPLTALVGRVVNGSSKSNCQSASVVKSGQSDTFESGTLFISVGGRAEVRLAAFPTSIGRPQGEFSDQVRITF